MEDWVVFFVEIVKSGFGFELGIEVTLAKDADDQTVVRSKVALANTVADAVDEECLVGTEKLGAKGNEEDTAIAAKDDVE